MEYVVTKIKDKKKEILIKVTTKDSNKTIILNVDKLIKTYFMNQEYHLVEELKVELIDNLVKIYLKYFSYGKNNDGYYCYQEMIDIFLIKENTYRELGLDNKVLNIIKDIDSDKELRERKIKIIKDEIDILNMKVKKITENIVLEYLKKDNIFSIIEIDKSLEKYFYKYFKDNYEYIKKIIQDNWQYKKSFEIVYSLEMFLTSIGGMYSFYQFTSNNDEFATITAISTILLGFISYYVSDRLENRLLDNKYKEIEKKCVNDKIKKLRK